MNNKATNQIDTDLFNIANVTIYSICRGEEKSLMPDEIERANQLLAQIVNARVELDAILARAKNRFETR